MGSLTLRLKTCRRSWLLVTLARLSATWSPPTIMKTWGVSLQQPWRTKSRNKFVSSWIFFTWLKRSEQVAEMRDHWHSPILVFQLLLQLHRRASITRTCLFLQQSFTLPFSSFSFPLGIFQFLRSCIASYSGRCPYHNIFHPRLDPPAAHPFQSVRHRIRRGANTNAVTASHKVHEVWIFLTSTLTM